MDIAQKFNFNNLTGYKIDVNLLREFESCLDPLAPEDCSVPCRVLGYGEISTVFEIQAAGMDGLAFKRMSIFETQDELDDYLGTYLEYNHMLEEDIGVQLPAHGHACLDSPSGRPIFYITQEKVRTPSIGNKAIHLLPESETMELIYCVLLELLKVWKYSCREENCQVGIDGQISNWVVTDFDPSDPILTSDASLMYVDTSTPMLRIDGEEQLDAELLLRSAPSFLAWILRLLFVQDVQDRYYDFRSVVIDLLANFYKEQLPERIPGLIEVCNKFFSDKAEEMDISPIAEEEVRGYYREDALIWSLYLSMRRFDRTLHRYIYRKDYPYILPGKIKR